MSEGPDGPSSDPQEFKLVHVRPPTVELPPRLVSLALLLNKSLSQNFFLPVECNEVVFLRKSLCIMHQSGFNLVKLVPEYGICAHFPSYSELSP